MTYLVVHLVCSVITILLQMSESSCDFTLGLLYLLFGPFGLIGKLLSIVL